jgi:hypothetical protein
MQWNQHFLYVIFDHFFVDAISHLPISQAANPSYLWAPSCSSRFTTNSAYLAILNDEFTWTSFHSPSSIWKDIWKLQLTDRLRLFLWKIDWDILPTKLRLESIIPAYRPDTPCLLCKTGPYSIRHLFFHCHYAILCDWIRIILSPGANLLIPRSEHH